MHLKSLIKIKQQTLCDAYSSRATWPNLSALSSIKRTQLNGNDLHPSVSSELLFEDEEPNTTTAPKFFYLYARSSMKNVMLDVSSYLIV